MDAVNNNGNTHFFFLPPLVPEPSFSGTFDGSLSPVVEICAWNGAACEQPLVAWYTMTAGQGSETVRLVPEDEHYVVNWHSGDFNLDPSLIYRIRVLVAETELGHADVQVVSSGRELRNVNTDAFVPLVDGRTLPVKFRIEVGAVSDLACSFLGEYVPDDNTVLLLHMNEDAETSVLRDASAYANDGVATGTVVVPGVFGNARRFDNAVNAVAEHFITLSNSATLNPSTAATFEFWVFPTATTSIVDGWPNGNPVLNRDDAWGGIPGYSFHLYTQPDFAENRPYFYDGVTLIGDEGLAIDRWSHVAFTFENVDGGKLGKLYVNGRLTASATMPSPLRTNNFVTYLGRRWGSAGGFPYNGGFLGRIDEVRISDRVRLPSEFNCQS
jgi:hypothetical protein